MNHIYFDFREASLFFLKLEKNTFRFWVKKRPNQINDWVLRKAATYSSTVVVPSAQTGLTSLFGKVRGEPRRYNHLSY